MHQRLKGFTLVELMVTIAVLAIVVTIAIPAFNTLIAKGRADTETGDFYRALNYARLEAVNRGINIRITPATAGTWAGALNIAQSNAAATPMRTLPQMNASSAMVAAGAPAYVEFNSLGALAYPAALQLFTYTNGSITRYVVVCVNGRVILNNGTTCP